MCHITINNNYRQVNENNSSSQLQSISDTKIDFVYDKIKEELFKYSSDGNTSLSIYFPTNNEKTTRNHYDIRMNHFFKYINDKYIQEKLIKKFKKGVKMKITYAILKYEYHMSQLVYTCFIMSLNWEKDYSKKKSCILIYFFNIKIIKYCKYILFFLCCKNPQKKIC